jgi:hypothetical protein
VQDPGHHKRPILAFGRATSLLGSSPLPGRNDLKMKTLIPLTKRVERYVDACPAAISGQRGHDQTFRVAIALVCGFDLSPELALPFLKRYNSRCEPPWNEDQLRHKLADAAKSRAARGYLL